MLSVMFEELEDLLYAGRADFLGCGPGRKTQGCQRSAGKAKESGQGFERACV